MSVYAEHQWYLKHYDEMTEEERFAHEQDWAYEGIKARAEWEEHYDGDPDYEDYEEEEEEEE